MRDRWRIDPDATYTQQEAAALAGVDPSTVHRARRAGRLPAARDGHAYRIRGADLLAWLGAPTSGPPPVVPGEIDPGRVYTMEEAGIVKGVAYDTVRRAVEAGRLRATRDGRRWAIRGGDLAAWAGRAVPAAGIDPGGRYTQAEAARLVGLSRQAVHNALAAGTLAAVDTVRGRRVRGADLLAWREATKAWTRSRA